MADPWQVVSQTPTATPPPPDPTQTGGGSDPWQVVSQTPTATATPAPPTAPTPRPDEVMPTAQQATSLGGPEGSFSAGALKKLKVLAAGLMDLANAPLVPGLTADPARETALSPEVQALATHLRQNTAATTPQEHAGGFSIDALMLANPAMWEGEAATAGMSVAQKIAAIGRNALTLEKNPGLLNMLKRLSVDTGAGIVKGAVPTGVLSGVESGGDPTATATGAITGGVLGGALEALPSAVGEIANVLKPTTESLEGVTMPVLANQKPGASVITKLIRPASDLPAIDAAQQAVPDQVIQSGAQRAIKNVIDQVNETRQIQGPAEASGTPPGTFKFTVDPIHPQLEAEPLTGARVAANAQELGPAAATIPERLQGAPVSDSQARLQSVGSIGSTIPNRLVTGETPSAPFETTDPNVAQKLLSEAQRVAQNPGVGPRLAARLDQRIQDLSDQLDQYHTARAAAPNFEPIDVQSAMDGVHDYGTAGDLMQNSVKDVYRRMNAATDGETSTLLQQPRWKSADRMAELFQQHSDQFTQPEWRAASDATRKGFVAKDLNAALQKAFNITQDTAADTADIGGVRRFSGSEATGNAIDKIIADNGDDVRDMIGDEGIRSLRRMNVLLKAPETHGPLMKLLNTISVVARRHGGPVAGMLGAAAGPFLGLSHYGGALGGIAAGEGLSYVVNRMATSPAIADRIAYAVTHSVSNRIAAPLIAAMMNR
jgi:hypothetical protein